MSILDLASGVERRLAVRVPVRGVAVLHTDDGPLHGTLENLSQSGALVNVAARPTEVEIDVELRLVDRSGWINAHTVRVEQLGGGHLWRVALAFDRVDPAMRSSIDASIADARSAARRRPILVIDDQRERRASLIDRLVKQGMTPLAPKTPLEAIDLLTRAQLHVSVCLLAPGFGVPTTDLASLMVDSFPWVTTADISDDLDDTVVRAVDAWAGTPVARFGAGTV